MKSLKEVMQIVRNAIDSQGVNLGLCGLSGSLRDENILTTQEHELLINHINKENPGDRVTYTPYHWHVTNLEDPTSPPTDEESRKNWLDEQIAEL